MKLVQHVEAMLHCNGGKVLLVLQPVMQLFNSKVRGRLFQLRHKVQVETFVDALEASREVSTAKKVDDVTEDFGVPFDEV